MKSATCFSHNGAPLSEFYSESEAQESADYENSLRPNADLVPYKCEKCGRWHLKPKEFLVQKLSSCCSCVDSNGRAKDAYPSQEEAQKMANIRAKAGVHLAVYKCPEGNGWHLTSHSV